MLVGKKKGRFIVIEGIDGSGKTLQSSLLKQELNQNGYTVKKNNLKNNQVSLLGESFENKGYKVEIEDFPRYETSVWGNLVGRMLMGEFGDLFTISPYLSVLPYMIDEYWGSQKIKKWVDEGKYVISNRYFTSNVHQVAKLKGKAQTKYREWLWKTGWDEMKILKPDLVIVLFVDPQICLQNILNKQKREYVGEINMDQAEASLDHQKRAAAEYKKTIIKYPKWWVGIDCCKNGKLLSPEEVAAKVSEQVKKLV